MNRSLPLFLAAFATIACVPAAHADLDSLLGDWADAASREPTSDVSLTSAAEIDPLDASDYLKQSSAVDWAGDDFNEKNEFSEKNKETENEAISLTGAYSHQDPSGQSAVHHQHDPTLDLYAVPTPTANPYYTPSSGGCDCGQSGCDSGSCGCQSGCGELVDRKEVCHLDGQSECRPHRKPSLPPPSTFLQLFRSRNSYSAVWDGYAEETRLRCRNRSPHLDGTWRSQGCGAMLEPGAATCDGGCQAGSCGANRSQASCQGGDCGKVNEPCQDPCAGGCDD